MPRIYTLLRSGIIAALACLAAVRPALAQGISFSQLVNMPMLVSPASTGLITEDDYRARVQYRNQWGAVPVPFNTFVAAVDGQALRKSRVNDWLGLGLVVLNDKAGEGSMSMTRIQVNTAYHLGLGKKQMLSAGLGVANVMRRVDVSQLVFEAQWDGFTFNPGMTNMEPSQGGRASYLDFSTGIDYVYFPNKYAYLKGTIGVDHVNSPIESVFKGGNVVKPRTNAMVEANMVLSNGMIFNPSLYFTTQSKSWQALAGGNVTIPLFDSKDSENLVLGVYYRVQDAIVIMAGYEYKRIRFTASYDYTVSNLGQYISHNGAFELGIAFRAYYPKEGKAKNVEAPSAAEPGMHKLRIR
jgi:type IX secretion system PorP/SprF family membrane protein